MSWLAFWLIAVVVRGSQGCLKCSPEAMQVLNELKGPYLDSKLHGDPELKEKVQDLLERNIEKLSWHPLKQNVYMGVIDEVTLQQLSGHFRRSMRRIMDNQFEDGQLFNEIMWSLQDLPGVFEKLLSGFQKVYCSNECGRMDYIFISCSTCKTNEYSCEKNLYCGERKVQVETDEDLILDCALWWHKHSHSVKTYDFYRVVGGKKQKMTTTMDSFLVKKEANTNDSGRYHCKMLGPTGYSDSELDFLVTVVPSDKTTWFPRPSHSTLENPKPVTIEETTWFPRPSHSGPSHSGPSHSTLEAPDAMGVSSRAPPPEPDSRVWIVIGTTGGLLVIIVAAFIFYYWRQNKQEEEEDSSDDDEEDEDESESS